MRQLVTPNKDSLLEWMHRLGLAIIALVVIESVAIADPAQHLEMFLDDARIASSAGVRRVLQQPDRLPDPIITGAGRWDPRRSYGSVIYDESENLYKAWYQINASGNSVAYATSVDGLNWDYPNVGLVEYSDSATLLNTNNNMLFRGLGFRSLLTPSVIKDDSDPDPSRRYKMVYFDSTAEGITGVGGAFTGTSPDGIHWTRTTTPAAPELYVQRTEQSTHDVLELMYDSQKQKYVIYSKGYDRTGNANDHRQIVRTESSDFINWSTPEVVLRHDNTLLDPQSYGSAVFEYEGIYVMPLRIYHNTGRADGQRGDRTIDVQLAASRDGINWTRVADKETFMGLGPVGAWDDGMIFPYRPFEKDGQIKIYYGGWNGPHEDPDGTPVSRVATVGLATLDAGRFVAMATDTGAPDSEGVIITESFVMGADGLFINADPGNNGSIRVALLDEDLNEISGFTGSASTLTRANALYYELSYEGEDLTSLEGQSISARFLIKGDAKLYGYTGSRAVIPEPTSMALLFVAFSQLLNRWPQPRRDNVCRSLSHRHRDSTFHSPAASDST